MRRSAAAFTVREPVEADWDRVRGLRLEMLRDEPIAYLETLAAAEQHPEAYWRARAAGAGDGPRILLVAEGEDGRFIGQAGGVLAGGRGPATLVAVYVAPDRRGRRFGVLDALLAGIEAWARGHGDLLLLEVHEANARARAAYEHRGFVATGRTVPYPLPPGGIEIEMVERL